MDSPISLKVIDRLRRIARAAAAGGGEDGTWFAAAIARYVAQAPAGLTLDAAFGLSVLPGGEPWFATAARQRRDQALCDLAAESFPGAPIGRCATELRTLVLRYGATRWQRVDRHAGGQMPAAYIGTALAHLFAAFVAGDGKVPASDRKLREILATNWNKKETLGSEIPPFHCQESGRKSA